MPLSYAFRLPPGPDALAHAQLAERLGYERIWMPEVPAHGHDVFITLARIAERTERLGIGPAVLVPSYRHPVAQASAIATLEHIAPGRVMAGFGTGFTGRAGLGQKPLSLAAMREHLHQVRALLRGDVVSIEGAAAQLLPATGALPELPLDTPLLLAAQGPKGRALAREVADGLIALGTPEPGHACCLVSLNGTVIDAGETLDSPRVQAAVKPLVATAYHVAWTRDPEAVLEMPKGEAWLASVNRIPADRRHLSVHRGHNFEIANGHDELVDVSIAKELTFTGTRDELSGRLAALEAAGATGVIFGTSGTDVPRELHAFAELVGLKPS